MINEGEEGWKESVENDEQVEGRSEKSTGLSGGCIQEEEEGDYLQDLRVRDLGLSGGNPTVPDNLSFSEGGSRASSYQ